MKLEIIASVKCKHIPENFQYFSPLWMCRLFIHTLLNHRCSCESQMIYACLEKAILSVIHCIIHLWVFFPCAPVGNNGAFVDQKITKSAATSNRKRKKRKKRKKKKDLRTRGRQSSQTTALKRGGACGMKGGNAVVSSRRQRKLLDGLTSVCTAEVADAPQSGGKAGGELPDERTITS